ncbi:hypothetical protein T492DRAFT_1053284 [Pavlovales sp. CCMP2436]|nr:hypothetical protein T492DRAFT_1053284 [Pavlovales sp. CCMP2436]
MGVVECVNHELMESYPVLYEKPGEVNKFMDPPPTPPTHTRARANAHHLPILTQPQAKKKSLGGGAL